ncbi:hypothetical protein PM082_007277 [Marasmius tenuissimus]|nr:hypothetical protein PM082_007277 [Marasmius tenuissimus]
MALAPAQIRTILYSLIIFFALAVDAIASLGFATASQYPASTGLVIGRWFIMGLHCATLLFALFTWVWASILLAYNRRPPSTRKSVLTRVNVNFLVTFLLCIAFIVMTALDLTFVGINCSTERAFGWQDMCDFNIAAGALMGCLSLLLGFLALYINARATRKIASLDINDLDDSDPKQL